MQRRNRWEITKQTALGLRKRPGGGCSLKTGYAGGVYRQFHFEAKKKKAGGEGRGEQGVGARVNLGGKTVARGGAKNFL